MSVDKLNSQYPHTKDYKLKVTMSLNSSMNDSYTSADDDPTNYYSALDISDSTIVNSEDADIGFTKFASDCAENVKAILQDDLTSQKSLMMESADVKTKQMEENVTSEDIDLEDNYPCEDAKPEIFDVVKAKPSSSKVEDSGELFDSTISENIESNKELTTKPDAEEKENEDVIESKDLKNATIPHYDKISEDSENYVEEYLDEEYLEYETAEGEPVTGDNDPNTVMTPSDSDDDTSDNSPVMAYLERNENLSYYKNNPNAIGIPNQDKESDMDIGISVKKKNASNGLASLDNSVTKYRKIIPKSKLSIQPKYALIKEAKLYNNIPRHGKLKSKIIDISQGVIECIKEENEDFKSENMPLVKKPRERKQVLEPSNVDVVFELEKVKKEEVKKAKKKIGATKNVKESVTSSIGSAEPSDTVKQKRKWVRRKEVKPSGRSLTPQRSSKRLSGKRSRRKTCAIASCKCDLEHDDVLSDSDNESEKDYENTSDFSDEWQLSPKSITQSSPLKVKVYTNIRKRHHSQKSTFDEDSDELSNDLLTLMKEDEKSNKEIDLNKDFPDKCTSAANLKEEDKQNLQEIEIINAPIGDKNINTENIVATSTKTLRQISSDNLCLFNTEMILIEDEDEKEFKGFKSDSTVLVQTSISSLKTEYASSHVTKELVKDQSTENPGITRNLQLRECQTKNKANTPFIKKNYICRICKKSFGLKKQLALHEHVHKNRVTCRYCSKTFSYNSMLKEHVRRNCVAIKITERNNYLRELTKSQIETGKSLKSKFNKPVVPADIKKYDKRNMKISTLRKSADKLIKIVRTPRKLKTSLMKDNRKVLRTTKKHVRLVVPKQKVNINVAAAKSNMRNSCVLKEINKVNNNLVLPSTSSQISKVPLHKCRKCKLDFNTTAELQKHESTIHKNVRNECKKCFRKFISNLQLSKHEFSCKGAETGKLSTRRTLQISTSNNTQSGAKNDSSISLRKRPSSTNVSRKTMDVSTLNQILTGAKNDKSIPLRKRPAHTGVPLSSKMQKVFENMKKDIKNVA